MNKIKTFEQIYINIKSKFYNKTKIDVARGSVIDMLIHSIGSVLSEVHKEIEDNKTPYIFTKQKKEQLDSTGYFLQCPRLPEETDDNYFYRLTNWTKRNASCNKDAIEDSLKELEYSISSNYIPLTKGVGTGTVYLIPNEYTEEYINLAINEANTKIKTITSTTSIIDCKVPEPLYIKLVSYLDVKKDTDKEQVKKTIEKDIKTYINSIAPGDSLMLGQINLIGLNADNVEYFNTVQIYMNDKEVTDFEILQTVEAKFIFDQIIYWEVNN